MSLLWGCSVDEMKWNVDVSYGLTLKGIKHLKLIAGLLCHGYWPINRYLRISWPNALGTPQTEASY